MSGYSQRRAPNVSQYIANLNAIPSAQDVSTQDGYSIDEDLSLFTNAEFFDFDLGETIENPTVEYDPAQEERARRENAGAKNLNPESKEVGFDGEAYQFPAIPFVPADTTSPSLQTHFPQTQPPFNLSTFNSPASPFNIDPQLKIGDKRPHTALSTTSLESSSRAAAEEDKRRRNTAASARFRVKKKQREQALEKTAKEMTDRAEALEARISQLETENKWLRNLVVEKSAKGKEDVADLWRKFMKENESRSMEDGKKGVGTIDSKAEA